MESKIFNDKSVKPDHAIVFSIIGNKSILWQQIMSYLYDNHKDISEEWNYYNDGKIWLFRTLKGKKTIFWIRVLSDTFRIAFWFGDKAEPIIEHSELTEDIKNGFKAAKKMGVMGRCISIEMLDLKDFDQVKKLIEFSKKSQVQ